MAATPFDRRSFLQRAGLATVGAATLTLGAARPAARADEDLAPFAWGVASGDPAADGVVLWTRVDPSVGSSPAVSYVVARDVDLTDVVESGQATTSADRDHTIKIDVRGLEPATFYYYGFMAPDGRRSLTGRTKTAPSGAVHRLRFGMVSCSNYEGGFFNAYARLAERNDLDAILHLGDYLYEYEPGHYGPGPEIGRAHEPPVEQVTLEQYRRRQAHYKLDPDLRRLHQLYPWITTWDDHETTNDSWEGGAENHDPETEGDWEQRKRTALRAYDEWMPIRMDAPVDDLQLYRALKYGDLVDILVLDTRIDGRDEPAAGVLSQDPEAPLQDDLDDPAREMISEAQRTWLLDRLATTTSQWKLLAQQVMMMQWKAGGLPVPPEGSPDFPTIVTPGGTPVNGDAWDGFPAERARVLTHIRDSGIDDVVVLTGDIHSSWAADLTLDPYRVDQYDPVTGDGSLAVEFVCPSVTSSSFYKTLGYPYRTGSIPIEEGTKADNPHIKFVQGDDHGYVLLDITAERCQAQFWSAHDVFEPNENHRLMAAWETLAGTNHVVAATAAEDPEDGPLQPGATPPADQAQPEPAPEPLPATGGGAAAAGIAALGVAGFVKLAERRDRKG